MVATRESTSDTFGAPVFLENVNVTGGDWTPDISPDELMLLFCRLLQAYPPHYEIWMARREAVGHAFSAPTRLPPQVNVPFKLNASPHISPDGSTLYFGTDRAGGSGGWDLWQASIEPVVDLDGDGIVDSADMCIIVDHWGADNKLCDIGPMPWGDGVVDVQDLIVLAEHLFEVYRSAETVEVSEDNDCGQIELELGKLLVVTLESNPSTGYQWELIESNESILKQFGQSEYKPSETSDAPIVGTGGREIFRFKAISSGQMTLQLVYRRPWEEGAEPLKTFSLQVVVP